MTPDTWYYYAVAYHGTAGLGASYGYAEVWEGRIGRLYSSATETFVGPFGTRDEAEAEAARLNVICEGYREQQDRH